jgi:mitochondrial fission protein ELM1
MGCLFVRFIQLLENAIHIASMSKLDDNNNQFAVTDFIDNTILALPNSIAIVTRQLLAARGSRFIRELLNAANQALSVLLGGNGQQFLSGRGLDQNPISSHFALDP